MPTLEERVAYIEGQVNEQGHALLEVRDAIRALEQRMDTRFGGHDHRFDAIDRRFEALDRRFEALDRRFELVDRRFEAVDRRFEAAERRFDGVDRRIDRLDDKVSRQFLWLVGLHVTTLVAIVSTLLARG